MPYGIRKQLGEGLRERLRDYMQMSQISVGCLTWNCAGNAPPIGSDLSQLILPSGNELKSRQETLPQVYIVGL